MEFDKDKVMNVEPQQEHRWLQRLVGTWTGDFECSMGPEQPPLRSTGVETVRSIGGLWTVGEGEGECPMTHAIVRSIMTLGYDLQKKRFVGTFIASAMTHLWVYEGGLEADGKRLVLNNEGPDFRPGKTGTARYQDVIEFVDDDHRTLTSQMLGEDGKWHPFMVGHYQRLES